jgi:predicted small metal-binding protein
MEAAMGRKFIDCRAFPSEVNCSITIMADTEAELLNAAVQHAVAVHGREDTPELRDQLRGAIPDAMPSEAAPSRAAEGPQPSGLTVPPLGSCAASGSSHLLDENTARAGHERRQPMPITPEPNTRSVTRDAPRMYPPDLRPLLQELLAALADMDLAHQGEVAIVRGSNAEEWLKQTVIRKLEERHRERRAPYVRQLTALEERIRRLAA